MQRQMAQGRYAYVMEFPRTTAALPKVDIFDAPPVGVPMATVEAQRAFMLAWMSLPLTKEDP